MDPPFRPRSQADTFRRALRAFDEISREQDAHYSARSFVRWVRLETTTERDKEPPSGPIMSKAREAA